MQLTLREHKARIDGSPLRRATLVFLVRPGEVLLAMKRRGFGQGKWNGVGGKVRPGETTKAAAAREVREEIDVILIALREMATLDFYFTRIPEGREWDQRVSVFVADRWQGDPTESEEVSPRWFPTLALPFDRMWPDDRYWLPEILAGRRILAEFLYEGPDRVIDYAIRALTPNHGP